MSTPPPAAAPAPNARIEDQAAASRDDPVAQLNAHQPAIIRSLGGQVLGYDAGERALRMGFDITTALCHSVDIVQGGIVTAMLDASMAHVVLATEGHRVGIASIDIQVCFLRPARAGRFTAIGRYVKPGRSIAFLKAELFNATGDLVATATSAAHLSRPAA